MTALTLSKILFENWKNTKFSEGYHLPSRCPIYERNDNFDNQDNADIIHCSKCLASLTEYENLTDAKKDELLQQAKQMIEKFGD